MTIAKHRWRTPVIRTLNLSLFLSVTLLLLWRPATQARQTEAGTLQLTILDAETGEPTPARVEVLDQEGKGYVAEDAIPVDGVRTDRKEPWAGTVEEALARLNPEVTNHFSRTVQFYSSGSSRLVLPPGSYDVKIRKGFEFETLERRVEVQPGLQKELTFGLSRWADMKEQGWYSADHHLHIARSHRDLDPLLSQWMQAEDIHIATFLRWGHSQGFHNTPQYAFGSDSVYRSGPYLLASGQENPRTHILGHTIMLGARDPVDFPDRYLIYRLFHEEAHRQGALSGYAHGGFALGAINGLSIDLPLQLLKFVEVHQIATGYYDVWYNILNTGFRISAVAGTDYPFSRSLPGMERFYTRIEGTLTYEAWLEGIRQGRTFVTNGPLLEFRVDGRQSGDELVLTEPGTVRVQGCVRFDPSRDELQEMEIIQNGQVRKSFRREGESSSICADFEANVKESGWWALRTSGDKLDPAGHPASWAHSGAVYVMVQGTPPLFEHDRAKALALTWAARLQEMEFKLFHRVDFIGRSHGFDEVERRYLLRNREELLKEIRRSKEFFQNMAR